MWSKFSVLIKCQVIIPKKSINPKGSLFTTVLKNNKTFKFKQKAYLHFLGRRCRNIDFAENRRVQGIFPNLFGDAKSVENSTAS